MARRSANCPSPSPRGIVRMQRNDTTDFFHVTVTKTSYFTLQPQIEYRPARGTHWRTLRATLHQLAGEAELGSADEGWCVRIEVDSEHSGRVVLELVRGDEREAERGAVMLRAIAELHRLASLLAPKAGAR